MLLYGVVKGFWHTALQARSHVLSSANKRKMSERSAGMIETSDFNSKYADITVHYKNWKIYDWLAWVDVWSNFILMDVTLHGVTPTPT